MNKAIELNVDRIEVDVVQTIDGELVLVHDAEVHDRHGVKLPIRLLRVDQLRDLVVDLLTLAEFFEMIGPTTPVLLDLKLPGCENAVAAAIKAEPDRDIWISTTHARSIFRLRKVFPSVKMGLSSGHLATALPSSLYRALAARCCRALMPVPLLCASVLCSAGMIMVNFETCTPWLVRIAHAGGFRVAVWTVNHPADIAKMVELDADAIISNRPDLVQALTRH